MKTFQEFILECQLFEGIKELPANKMQAAIKVRKEMKRNIFNRLAGNVPKDNSRIDKMQEVLKTHDPVASEFKELENRERGRVNRKKELENDYVLGADGKYRRKSRLGVR
jgi:hypothetical protein